MASGIEQRKGQRVPTSRPVVFIVEGQSTYATMTDFSHHGIGFMSSMKLRMDTKVEVHFDMPNPGGNSESFKFDAEVKHCMDVARQCHIGVRFENETNEEYESLFEKNTG